MRASSRSRSTNLASWFAERAGERFDEEAVLLAAGAWVADELRAKDSEGFNRIGSHWKNGVYQRVMLLRSIS